MEGWRELWILTRLSGLVIYLVLNLAPFFLYRTTLHSMMIYMLSCGSLIQRTSPIFNFWKFGYACKMPSQIFLVVCHIFCRGCVRGSWVSLSCSKKISGCMPMSLTKFSFNSINHLIYYVGFLSV